MIRITAYLILLFSFVVSFSQDSRYNKEEFKALDDIFLDITDTSSYFITGLWDLYPIEDLIDLVNDSAFLETLDYLISRVNYEPYDIISGLKETGGDSLKIAKLVKDYKSFKDSITGLPDDRKLVIFHSDSLYNLDSFFETNLGQIKKFLADKDSESFKPDTLKTRYFSLDSLNKIGRYTFSNKQYPDQFVRFETKEIKELYSLQISRVIFNSDNTRGALLCTFYWDMTSSFGNLYLIKKKKGRWIIYKSMTMWIS